MDVVLEKSVIKSGEKLILSGSKSESNRLLLLLALFPQIELLNLSTSDDTKAMQDALKSQNEIINIGHAGTAMRFLTAYFSTQNKTITLTGSSRMCDRPIGILVNALRELGANIEYVDKDGFPPLKIIPSQISANQISLDANVSSQYISALLLIAPTLKDGLEVYLQGEITSAPYIEMTLQLLSRIGIETAFEGNKITVKPKSYIPKSTIVIESDWSSASYIYSAIALSPIGTFTTLTSFHENSLQGDKSLVEIYEDFGVSTTFKNNEIIISKTRNAKSEINFDLKNTPDLAQTIAVTCAGLGISCTLSGLATLKIKETDRLLALQTELAKFGVEATITNNSLMFSAHKMLIENIEVNTYNDHRMAMAFAPLALKVPLIIRNAEVVSKSYPNFWSDFELLGFQISHKTS